MGFCIIETDNFNRDYPSESFVNLPRIGNIEQARRVSKFLNEEFSGIDAQRYWKIETDDYELQPGFEI